MGYLEPESRLSQIPELKWLRKEITERALTRGPVLLAGGSRSDFYIDKFRLFSEPAVLRRIARLFTPIVAELNPDLLAGTEVGGVIVATVVAQMANIPMIVVRKEPKAYGAFAHEYVEGPYEPGQKVLLLEDIVSGGGEAMAAKARLEELELKVTVYAVINRGLAPVKSLIQFSLPRGEARTEN